MDPCVLLREMVEIESLSGAEASLGHHLVARMGELGYDEAFLDEAGNAVGVRRGPPSAAVEREIVLLGHMDTVPGRIPVRLEGDSLYGRGSVDAKGPLATFITAVAGLEPAPGVRLVVVGAVEEEAPTSKGAHFAATQYRPEACLIGEPSGWDALTLGYKGRLLVAYRHALPAGHSAGPEGTVAERAAAFWQAVLAHCDAFNHGREKLFDQLLPTLQEIHTSSDGLHDAVEMTVGFRLPPNMDASALETALREHAEGAELTVHGAARAWSSPRTSPLARAFQRAAARRDLRLRFKHKTGTSDMNVLGPAWGCPIAAYGPGDSLLDHTPDEHVSLTEYRSAIALLHAALVEAGYARSVASVV